ncbi:MAG: hypothetical protein M3112_06230 [Actinomycetia bacterium]|nr:hypothetical protein [Actinomycetes bacterium]
MTDPTPDHGRETDGANQTHVVLATHSREVKTALFHSLNALSTITIVATATSTAELVSYSHAFRPEIVIVETGLPGHPLTDVLIELATAQSAPRVLLIGEDTGLRLHPDLPAIEIFADLELLIAAFPEQGADTS